MTLTYMCIYDSKHINNIYIYKYIRILKYMYIIDSYKRYGVRPQKSKSNLLIMAA